ncbi:MAG TPA: glycosyltransferase family protein [Caulobacter sp.]|nr:glycosyltransferase family protein [Caulobacter sp.]
MILAILQARMSSTRLPGKVLMPLAGAPMMVRQIERVARSRRIDRLVVATSANPGDDPIEKTARREGIEVHRGPLDDVLARFLGALAAHPAEAVVRLTADCPFADPQVIDETIEVFLESGADYASNTPPTRTFPKGLDVEVMTAAALRQAGELAASDEEREHVTWGIYNRPDRFRLAYHSQPAQEGEVRWTVDRPDDYAFAAAVYDALYPKDRAFTSDAVRAFVRGRPDLMTYGGDRRA